MTAEGHRSPPADNRGRERRPQGLPRTPLRAAPLRVLCVKWGDKYGADYVYRLKAAVKYWLDFPHQFVCMTDEPIDGVDCVPTRPDLPTWWQKVALFEPGRFPGNNLYLDLDVVLTAPITPLVEEFWPGYVVAPDDFSYSLLRPRQGLGESMQRLLGGPGTVNSSVMLWTDPAGAAVWDNFTPEKMDEVHGDQNWITQALWPDRLRLLPPGLVCSYKYHFLKGQSPSPVVVFHGDPKPDQLGQFHPMAKAWRGEH